MPPEAQYLLLAFTNNSLYNPERLTLQMYKLRFAAS